MRRLLVVDDSRDLLYAMKSLLGHYDFEVRTATNSKTFQKEIASFNPEIIIIDVILFGENGRDICKSFGENPENNNVIVFLFSASPNHLKDFEECGADGIIEKPFGIKELVEKINNIAKSRRA